MLLVKLQCDTFFFLNGCLGDKRVSVGNENGQYLLSVVSNNNIFKSVLNGEQVSKIAPH